MGELSGVEVDYAEVVDEHTLEPVAEACVRGVGSGGGLRGADAADRQPCAGCQVKVLVAVTGGIAAYKAAEVVRELQRRGVEVEVAMTAAAEEFVRPLTFAALTGRPVLTSLWEPAEEPTAEVPIEHIGVAQRMDAMVVCPATAHTLAKMAQGLSDDLVTTVYPGDEGSGDCGSGDEREHVGACGDGGQPAPAA